MTSCLLWSRDAKVMKSMRSGREFICALIDSFRQFVPIRFPCYRLNLAGYILANGDDRVNSGWSEVCFVWPLWSLSSLDCELQVASSSCQFVSLRVARNLARDIDLENDGRKCCSINPRTAGGGGKVTTPPFFLNNFGSRKNSRCAFTYSSGYSIRTLWWFIHRKITSGYPVATSTTDVGRNSFI